MSRWEDLNSDKALVCRREINSEQGNAVVWCVLLSDGHLLDCGSSGVAERRAVTLAQMINEAGPEWLSHKALMVAQTGRDLNDGLGLDPRKQKPRKEGSSPHE